MKIDTSFLKDILEKLINCDTQCTNKDDSEIISLLKGVCEGFGMTVEVIATKTNRNKMNFVAYWKNCPHEIVLSSHFDTVPIGDISEWKYLPLKATEEINPESGDLYIYGRGSADMKSGLASQLCILKFLFEEDLKVKEKILFVVSSDEEDGTLGAKDLVKQRPDFFSEAKLVIVDEPTNLDIGISEKGELRLKVECRGISAHASSPYLGLNAIEGMYLLIQYIQKCLPFSPDFSNQTTLNVGTINGGSAPNVVPDYCVAEIDIRTSSVFPVEDVMVSIKKVVSNLERTTKYQFDISEESREASVTTNIDNPYVQLLAQCIHKENPSSKMKRMSYATDASSFVNANNKLQVIIFGPGNEEVIHKPNEYVVLKNVETATKAVLSFLCEISSLSVCN